MSKISIIGETFLNRLTYGKCQKISSEAPIPVFEFEEEFESLGGLGEVASHLVNFGYDVDIFTTLGDDHIGTQLYSLLTSAKIDIGFLGCNCEYTNGMVQRFVISGHHLLRLEIKKSGNFYNHILELLHKKQYLNSNESESYAIICDYDTKEFDAQVLDKIYSGFSTIIVDTSLERLTYFPDVKIARTFFWGSEYSDITKDSFVNFLKNKKIENSIENLVCSDLNTGNIILIDHNNNSFHLNSGIGDVIDVVGLREGQLAVLIDQVISGKSIYEAAKIAAVSSRITVRKIGAHIFSKCEIEELKLEI